MGANKHSKQGKLYGYARVSTKGQDTERQVDRLKDYGVRRDDLYVDHGVSGAAKVQPQLEAVIALLEQGDELVVTDLDRLGRKGTDMAKRVEDLSERGVWVNILSLGMQPDAPFYSTMIQMLSALAQAERVNKNERLRSSMEHRRANGGDLGGRPKTVSDDVILGVKRDVDNGMSVAEACRRGGRTVSRPTYYRRIAALENSS